MIPLPRLHLFEIEDLPWCPAIVRDLATDYLHFIETKVALHRPVAQLLAPVLHATGVRQVVDLCSGGAGPIPSIQKALLIEGLVVDFVLTDRYPNTRAFERAAAGSDGRISFVGEPVDARAVPKNLEGMRTLFNAFHHFRPADAAGILRDAVQAAQPIGIFELSDRTWRTSLAVLVLMPLMVALTTPFIRPFRWTRLLLTYLLPLVPVTCWWDGMVSQLRAYTPSELQSMAKSVATDTYSWRVGRLALGPTRGNVTYLLGFPRG